MKVNEVINLIQDNYPLYSLYSAEELINNKTQKVASNLYIDERRHYEISTDVYKCEDGYIGITGPSKLYSEQNSWEDIDEPCFASEFIAVSTITYKQKQ